MAKAKKTAVRKKTAKTKAVSARKVTAAKAGKKKQTIKKSTKKAKAGRPKAKGGRPKAKTASKKPVRKLKKYTPRSRYTSYKIGDRVQFGRIKNWEGDSVLEKIVGIVVDKIEDKELGLRFIEVQFNFRDYLPLAEDNLKTRRFVVK